MNYSEIALFVIWLRNHWELLKDPWGPLDPTGRYYYSDCSICWQGGCLHWLMSTELQSAVMSVITLNQYYLTWGLQEYGEYFNCTIISLTRS